jgi:hypothetical protein
MSQRPTRGERNANPMNLRRTGTRWVGMAEKQTDEYVTFTDPAYGIRAGAKVLLTYQRKHKLRTVSRIINRWAPPHENATTNYINFVAQKLGVDPEERIDVENRDTLTKLVKAIIRFENGRCIYSDATIRSGVALA